MRDLLSNTTKKRLVPAVNTAYDFETTHATASVNGTAVDLKGEGRKCLVLIDIGATSTATLSLSITSGTDGSTFGTSEYSGVFDTTGLTVVDLTPSNRYIRAEYTVSATGALAVHTYVSFAVEALVYSERYRPSNVS